MRASICSSVEKINGLDLRTMRGIGNRPKRCKRIICVDGVIVVEFQDGSFGCNTLSPVCYGRGVWPWSSSLFKGLVKLGVISKEDYKRHMEDAKRASDEVTLKYDLESLEMLEERYGKRLTKLRKAKAGKQGGQKG